MLTILAGHQANFDQFVFQQRWGMVGQLPAGSDQFVESQDLGLQGNPAKHQVAPHMIQFLAPIFDWHSSILVRRTTVASRCGEWRSVETSHGQNSEASRVRKLITTK